MTEEKFKLQAEEALKFLRRTLFEHVYGIKLFRDNKFYTAFGYSTIEDFARDELDLGRAQLYYYLRIADKFLPGAFDSEVYLSGLFLLGVSKLKVLTNLDDNLINDLKNKGEFSLNSKTYTILDIKKLTVQELSDLIIETDKEETGEQDANLSFGKAYKRIERGFQLIIDSIRYCQSIVIPRKIEIEKHLRIIEEILKPNKEIWDSIKV